MKRLLLFGFFFVFFSCASVNDQVVSKEIQARMDLATSFLLKGKPRVSLRYLLPVKDRAKNNPDYRFLLGLVYFEMKKYKLAKDEFFKVIELKPNYAEAWNNLGLCYTELKEFDEAKKAFEKAMQIPTYLTPEYPAYNLANLYYNQKEFDKAKKYLKKSIEFNWRYVPSYLLLSKIYEEENDINSSVRCLERAMEADPDNKAVLLKLAEGYLKKGERERAIAIFKRIVEKFPKSDASKVAKDYLVILQ